MAGICCCPSSRFFKSRSSPAKRLPRQPSSPVPMPPPPVKLPGPLTLNPVASVPAGIISRPASTLPKAKVVPMAIIPIEPVGLDELLVEDSDTDEEREPGSQNKSNSTLQLVRTRLRRHISQDSLPKRKTRSAVGSSEEEIARRAELKRLMHKRIQEELRSEESHEPSQSDASSSHRRSPQAQEELPEGGPRDNLEFSMADEVESKKGRLVASSTGIPVSQKKPYNGDNRRASCSNSTPKHTDSTGQYLMRRGHSLPQMPPSPELAPRRMPSARETSSLASWRLSYSAGQLEELLSFLDRDSTERGDPNHVATKPSASRGLVHSPSFSQSYSSPDRQGSPLHDLRMRASQSPLDTWLKSQDLASVSASNPSNRSDSGSILEQSPKEAEIVYLRRCSSVPRCAVLDPSISRHAEVHLYDMDIHRQLGATMPNSPVESPDHSDSGRRFSGGTYAGNTSRQASLTQPAVHKTASCTFGDYRTVPSSQYPSTADSSHSHLSPSTSPFNPADVMSSRTSIVGLQLSNFQLPGNPWNMEKLSVKDQVNTPGSSPESVSSHDAPSRTLETSSLENSEPSIHQAILLAMKKRRVSPRQGTGSSTVASRKIGKALNASAYTPPATSKPSLFARLHLTIPRVVKLANKGLDGSEDPPMRSVLAASTHAETTEVSSKDGSCPRLSETMQTSVQSLTHQGILNEMDDTAEVWRRAIRDEVRSRSPGRRNDSKHARRLSLPDDSLCASTHGRDSYGQSNSHYDILKADKDCIRTSLDHCFHLAEDSSRGPIFVGGPSIAPCSISVVAPTAQLPSLKIRKTWAHFSSQDRDLLNGSAGLADRVLHKDLAALYLPVPGTASQSPERATKQIASPPDLDTEPQTVAGKLERAVRSGISKFMPSRAPSNAGSTQPVNRCRSLSNRTMTKVEYPEYKLLPDVQTSQEFRNPKEELHQLRGPASSGCLGSANDIRPACRRVTLTTRLSMLLQHKDDSTSMAKGSHPFCEAATTTANTAQHGKDSSRTTDRFITPLSGMSLHTDGRSFHPSSKSRAPFREIAIPEASPGDNTEAKSVKSEFKFVEKARARALSELDAFAACSSGTAKFKTWNGRSKTIPFLMSGTLDYGDDLQTMLKPMWDKTFPLDERAKKAISTE